MDRKRSKKSAGRRVKSPSLTAEPSVERQQRSSSVLWLKLNFTIKTARLQTLKRQKYQHLQEEALLKARGLLKNWEDGPVVLTEDLYSLARSEQEAQELLNYTPEALALRFSLRNHPDVIDAVKQLWCVELPRDEMGCIDQHGYASLFRRIGRSLEPDATKRRLRRMEKTIKEDWSRDSKGESVMSFATFFDSVFELADLWCETIDVDEYIAFLRRLVLRVSAMRRNKQDPNDQGKRMLRSLKQIKAIDNDAESSEEESPSEGDDDEDLSSGSDTDDSDEEDTPISLPSPKIPTHSMFIATKALTTMRPRTPSASLPKNAPDTGNIPDSTDNRPHSRERRASIISLGDFVGFSFPDNDKEDPKTPTGLRGSSAKSRVSSGKAQTPLTSVRENVSAATTEDGEVNALVTMHRLRSAQRTPVTVEDTATRTIPSTKVSVNVDLQKTNSPQQIQQKTGNLFTAAIDANTSLGTGSIDSEELPVSGGLHKGGLASSAPVLKTTMGLKAGPTFGSVDTASVDPSGARISMLSSSSKAKQNGDKKSVGIVFDAPAATINNKRLASSTGPSKGTQNAPGKWNIRLENDQSLRNPLNDNQSGSQAPREYISGLGFDGPAKDNLISKKAELLPVDPKTPFYTFDESVSPAKRLLPPVLNDTGGRGRSGVSSKGRRQRNPSTDHSEGQGLDFSESYKTTGYLTGSLQAEIISRNAPVSRNTDGRSLQSLSNEATRRRSSSKQMPKRMRKQAPDDGENDVTVSPWDTEFDNDHEDLARALPRPDKLRVTPIVTVPVASISKTQDSLDPQVPTDPPTLSVSSSMVPPEPPSCVSELTTLPHEYHELVLGKGLSRSESAPVRTVSPTLIHAPLAKRTARGPQWMLLGAIQPPLTLLEDGVAGRTVATSPRPKLAALTSKRPRREREVDEDDEIGLCPRFVEHLEAHGDRSATAPPRFRTDKSRTQCTRQRHEGVYTPSLDKLGVNYHCPCHKSSNNNWQDENDEDFEQEVAVDAQEDVTVIVNATRGLVLRPGTMDRLAAKRTRHKEQATRSEMMRRRSQYTFGKHLG
ncbi:hypothetical protein Pcac1_g11445 [Phytophthora cactorum]|uniref:Uncharacterized protein n=1 Tax=Phytophthora cactorum TaxID=29920 RepID=A0A329S2Y6_9STRA|nr:hypothetical protein Pcac1_g11445 [Phytophthora cactorum]KAG2830861.1 hypothetical protein PC111_g7214 [Phytophthora cactorum]KAG2860422.1 hypothetical protein PC113_g8064 [Phytophthora cactorum]KAG2929482.1 hypothetical protein PC115_g6847 [Phytophthora cactorum]KAG2945967.1 hypothetical protein PC117_g8015 [Phytophthora cactorum]